MMPKDYTNYLIFINVYMITLIAIFFFFFNTDYKRLQVKVYNNDVHPHVKVTGCLAVCVYLFVCV